MAEFKLKPGSVIRYEFLWKEDEDKGLVYGRKDRPCAVVLILKAQADEVRTVVVCPITHEPPETHGSAVEVPHKVARALKLDSERMWIKTHQVNSFELRGYQIPFSVTPAYRDRWIFGELPHALGKKMHQQVLEHSRQRNLKRIERDKGDLQKPE